jgi:uncharacterized FlgJ-related protein
MKSLCLTLFLFCQTALTNFDFTYSNNKEFVNGIIECTQLSNSFLPPHSRSIIIISVAQAALESDWGKSRFAQEGNNFYGVIETDPTSKHLKALGNPSIMIRVYDKKCESVADYINLLNTHHLFKDYQELRIKQYISGEVNVMALVETLEGYAVDPVYVLKLKTTIRYLLKEYPHLFHLSVGA